MAGILRDLKRPTAKELLRTMQESRRVWRLWRFERAGQRNARNTAYQFWPQGSQPIELHSNELRQQRLDYLHRNPVGAAFVELLEDFLYCP